MKSKKPYQKYIKDLLWTFTVLSKDTYIKMHGSNSFANTNYETKRVDFSEHKFSLALVRHELLHVYVDSCMLYSTESIDACDKEEIIAEIMEHHSEDFMEYSHEIYTALGGKK